MNSYLCTLFIYAGSIPGVDHTHTIMYKIHANFIIVIISFDYFITNKEK